MDSAEVSNQIKANTEELKAEKEKLRAERRAKRKAEKRSEELQTVLLRVLALVGSKCKTVIDMATDLEEVIKGDGVQLKRSKTDVSGPAIIQEMDMDQIYALVTAMEVADQKYKLHCSAFGPADLDEADAEWLILKFMIDPENAVTSDTIGRFVERWIMKRMETTGRGSFSFRRVDEHGQVWEANMQWSSDVDTVSFVWFSGAVPSAEDTKNINPNGVVIFAPRDAYYKGLDFLVGAVLLSVYPARM